MAAVLFFTGCAQMSTGRRASDVPGPEDARVVRIMSELERINQTLHSFSGVGKLTVKRKGQIQLRERVAWIGSAPDRLSVVVFISGFPSVRFATDGKWFYLIEPSDNKPVFRQVRASESALAQIIGIEISFEDIVALLRGRVPVTDYRTATLSPGRTDTGDELTLKKWWGTDRKIMLAAGAGVPYSLEQYDRSGAKRYQAVFEETTSVGGYRVPRHLRILADEGAEFSLYIDRYQPNVDVSGDTFVLNPVN